MGLFNDPKNLHLNYGLKIAAGLIAYFLLMKVIGLGHHVELRLLNLFILTAGIFFGLKKFKETHEDHLNYFRALVTGVAMGAIGSMIFSLFLFVYWFSYVLFYYLETLQHFGGKGQNSIEGI